MQSFSSSIRYLSSPRNFCHGAAFLFVACSKTIYNFGSACLTVDAAVMSIYCLLEYNDKQATPGLFVEIPNFSLQLIAASFSTIVVMLSRYPAIWNGLTLDKLNQKRTELQEALEDCGRWRIFWLGVIGFCGFFACVARGISAYLATEVILGERLALGKSRFGEVVVVIPAGIIAAITVLISSLLFNGVNMLTGSAKFLKDPKEALSNIRGCLAFIIMGFWFIGVLLKAVAMRFFIKAFLDRRSSILEAWLPVFQFVALPAFFVFEFVMGLFTIGSSFEPGWWESAKGNMGSSKLFTALALGDVVSMWLGYSSITIYDILVDFFLAHPDSPDNTICVAEHTNIDLVFRWIFVAASLLLGIPSALTYFNYILQYAKDGYDSVSAGCCRYALFGRRESVAVSSPALLPGYAIPDYGTTV